MTPLAKRLAIAASALALLAAAPQALAFCGFFVAKGDARLFNEASKVVMVRDGDRTVLTMVNDFEGEVEDFALVVPTPTVLERAQIHVTENAVVDHLDAYTAPRLVEYHDPDPCRAVLFREQVMSAVPEAGSARDAAVQALGVTIEAEYLVGEYDILILSATQSEGLETWLRDNGYSIPEGASEVLGSYIRQGMKFFVARVNLDEHAKTGGVLRPLQIDYESPKFMLPIRLGTVNAKGSQEVLLYTLTRRGRVETANYRTVRMPTDVELPLTVADNFGEVYRAIYDRAVEREGGHAVMLEYAWDMGWCDPCAADPLTVAELRELGVFWLPTTAQDGTMPAPDAFVTRLHARYDAESFPEDLRLMQTGDRSNFQGRYVVRQPYRGEITCEAGERYLRTLPVRWQREAQALAGLTGRDVEQIRAEMREHGIDPGQVSKPGPWWKSLWRD